ncbi:MULTISPECIES: hypothetical protein [Halomonas]|uniref:hypothetical protein n=1 Tax=Halomonas TaxID=2745 RepID=UPI001C93EA68|nr:MULTISPECIES: hypothetical protein [Halomonas]MBY6209374.1 hypothetical protein [Halomonas sp. DP3Y7-2]MBY6229529.1 hypothetical protein [Halomonas sp. DP3Y7-1]MCA0917412.1 hypothetical protein [Halomonas denitrificans]
MSIGNLKKELEATLLITDWSPTEVDLNEIARRIKALGGSASKADIEKIVYDVVGSYECMMMEGIDNADLTTLLILATKTTK